VSPEGHLQDAGYGGLMPLVNMVDVDSDNDGLLDTAEMLGGLSGALESLADEQNPDTDGDGVVDGNDIHPALAEGAGGVSSLLVLDAGAGLIKDPVDKKKAGTKATIEGEPYLNVVSSCHEEDAPDAEATCMVWLNLPAGSPPTATDGIIANLHPPLDLSTEGIVHDLVMRPDNSKPAGYELDHANNAVKFYLLMSVWEEDSGCCDNRLDVNGDEESFENNGEGRAFKLTLSSTSTQLGSTPYNFTMDGERKFWSDEPEPGKNGDENDAEVDVVLTSQFAQELIADIFEFSCFISSSPAITEGSCTQARGYYQVLNP
jgi:hypothetical protein